MIPNRRAFHQKPQTALKTPVLSSVGCVTLTVTPVVIAVISTSLTPSTSLLTPSTASSGSTTHPVNANGGPPWCRHQATMS